MKRFQLPRNLVFASAIVLALAICWAGCDEGGVGQGGNVPCSDHEDCSGVTEFCIEGFCVDVSQNGCVSDGDCPQGYRCIGQICKENVECQVDAHCNGEGVKCLNNKCVGTDCVDGAESACFIGCHEGIKSCINGKWGLCDAPLVQDELCDDDIDNDCDSETDEGCVDCVPAQEKPCATICGEGMQVCLADGTWGVCDASDDCFCALGETGSQACDSCGTQQRECGEDSTWVAWGACEGQGMCNGGDLDEETCGLCGKQIRICSDECSWSEWGECTNQGVCNPEDLPETKECGNCGIQERSCDAATCTWGTWGECQEGAGCGIGDSETKSCGDCGEQTRLCESDCIWGDWGSCDGEGSCAPSEKQSQPCGSCGQQERTCTASCEWGNWGSCQGAGACSPGDTDQQACGPTTSQGVCQKGTKTRGCGGNCQWNAWGNCVGATYPSNEVCGNGVDEDCDGDDLESPDSYESNDTCSSCFWISGDDPEVTLYGTFDTLDDSDDYFCFKGVDNFNVPGFGEHIKVDLTDQPVGIDADLFLYKGLSACNGGNAIASSITIGGGDEHIDWGETNGGDTETYYVRLQNYSDTGKCYQTYSLFIKGLK